MSDRAPDLTPGSQVKKLPKKGSKLGGAVPVRFNPDTIDRIKVQAEREGRTVSSWIRHEVEKALTQREVTVVNFRSEGIDPREVRQRLSATHG